MKTKHIAAFVLLAVFALGGCSQGSGDLEYLSEVSAVPTEPAEISPTAEDSEAGARSVSFLAGEKTASPTPEPKPTPKATETPRPKAAAKPSGTVNPAVTPEPAAAQKPEQTPKPTAIPQSTEPEIIPTPTATAQPTEPPSHTPAPMPEPTPSAVPEPSAGRTICNTCGADITGNVAAHGDSHLLNDENFSYRVE